MFALAELEGVLPLVPASVPSTPQYAWPLLEARTGLELVAFRALAHASYADGGIRGDLTVTQPQG